MSVLVRFLSPDGGQHQPPVVSVPKESVLIEPDGTAHLFIVEAGRAKRVGVRVVEEAGDQLLVEGLEDSPLVVASDARRLTDGIRVEIKREVSREGGSM
jgi:hypothetical protein